MTLLDLSTVRQGLWEGVLYNDGRSGLYLGNVGLDDAAPREWPFAGMKAIDCSRSI